MKRLILGMLTIDIENKHPAFFAGFGVGGEMRRTGIEPVTLGLKGPCSAN
jgi:hypothetical protein